MTDVNDMLDRVGEYVAHYRKQYIKGWKEQHKGPPPKARAMSDGEFVQWFDAMMAMSPRVTIRAVREPATKWMDVGTSVSGPAWFLALGIPSAEDTNGEIGRYKRLTGATNPLDEVLHG